MINIQARWTDGAENNICLYLGTLQGEVFKPDETTENAKWNVWHKGERVFHGIAGDAIEAAIAVQDAISKILGQ